MVLLWGILAGIQFMLYAFGTIIGLMIGFCLVLCIMVVFGFFFEWLNKVFHLGMNT